MSSPRSGDLTGASLSTITPGSTKAILTLADGKKRELDSTTNGQPVQENGIAITTPRGGQYQVILPDGTKVWLNAASSIKFPSTFANAKERLVEITGESYFEVAPVRGAQPFIISINKTTQIQVLGTSFNINAYTNEPTIKTTLITGSVRVQTNNQTAILKPGQQARIKSTITIQENADLEKTLAWKNGLFNFQDATLEEVMKQLERWYDIEVIYEKGIPNKQFWGQMSKDIPLTGLLNVLKTTGINFRLEGKKLIVLPD